MTINDIKEAIITLFNFSITEETEERILFQVISDKIAFLDKAQVNSIITKLNQFNTDQDVELFNNNSYEVLVRNENRMLFAREIEQKDLVNKIEYKIDKPTDNYLIFFLSSLGRQNTPRILRSGIMPTRLRRLFETQSQPQLFPSEFNIIDVIKDILPKFETLQITSDNAKKKPDFELLVYAFIFNLGYNLDYTFQPLRFMEEFTQPYRIGRLRRANFSDVEPPKKTYLNELILHYQKGISSESIDHQFLSFFVLAGVS